MYKVSGTLKKISQTQIVSEKFKKREFVLRTNEKFPQDIQFELTQDNCVKLDGLALFHDEIEVSFNLRGREWVNPSGEAKYFNSLQAWNIAKVSDSAENSEPFQNRFQTEKKEAKHWSGLNGEMAQDHVDQNMFGMDDDMPF
jgi:hypothetical protein